MARPLREEVFFAASLSKPEVLFRFIVRKKTFLRIYVGTKLQYIYMNINKRIIIPYLFSEQFIILLKCFNN